jgi:hypothetical protein
MHTNLIRLSYKVVKRVPPGTVPECTLLGYREPEQPPEVVTPKKAKMYPTVTAYELRERLDKITFTQVISDQRRVRSSDVWPTSRQHQNRSPKSRNRNR